MIRAIVRLAIVILIANATWRIGSAYLAFYRFKDAVTEVAAESRGKSDEELRSKVIGLAAARDEPLAPESITIRRDEHHTFIDGRYTKPVSVLPGYDYQWPFELNVDGFVIVPTKLRDLTNPQ